ncbi:hypothetical protein RQP46_008000 [Phenoliferia psychrophenolica]
MIDFSSEGSPSHSPPLSPPLEPEDLVGFAAGAPLRSQSRLVFPLLVLLVPATVAGILAFPVLVTLTLIPVLGFFAFPSLVSLALFLLYSITWTTYLLLAQHDPPTNVSLPFLPLSPFRCSKVVWHLLRTTHAFLSAGAIDLFLDLQVRRVMVLGGCVEIEEVGVYDLRRVLEWTGERIQGYGGDPDQIFILGYGSGAHLSLLTVVQDAVVRSRDEHLARPIIPTKADPMPHPSEVSQGIRRCRIWGEHVRLPPIAGLIFVSGVFDIIKQMRFEAKAGIEDLSSLRRACGPSTAASLLSCPSHLLFGAKEILEPDRLPPKVLIIAGGADTVVPYSQAVLLRTLFQGVGITVRLKLYREETHLGSLASEFFATSCA